MRRKYDNEALAELTERAERITLKMVEDATEANYDAGLGWYAVANAHVQELAAKHKISGARAAAIIAVMSPMVRWAHNIADAYALGTEDGPTWALQRNIAKAERLLDGEPISEVLGGRKVKAFWLNIGLVHSAAVTLDTHIAKAFHIDAKDVFERVGVYDALTLGVARAAFVLDIEPKQAQAIVWLEQSGRDGTDDLPDPY